MTKRLKLANELMSFHDACTMDGQGGDGQFRILCSSGSSEQALALRSVLREAAACLRSTSLLEPTEEMVMAGANAMVAADTPDGPSYETLARACLAQALSLNRKTFPESDNWRRYAAFELVRQAAEDLRRNGDITGVTTEKMKKLFPERVQSAMEPKGARKEVKPMTKAWNGGSIESAMQYARERRDAMISQGATLCDECGGEGGLAASGVCQQCHGAGCIVPAHGLSLSNGAR